MTGNKGAARAGGAARAMRNAIRRKQRAKETGEDDGIPDIYREMLAEAGPSVDNNTDDGDRPRKRPRLMKSGDAPNSAPTPIQSNDAPHGFDAHVNQDTNTTTGFQSNNAAEVVQTVYDDSEGTDDSDIEWEEVDLGGTSGTDSDVPTTDTALPQKIDGDITITLDDPAISKSTLKKVRRRGVTNIEKQKRLLIHKMHILCLLYHVHLRNAWCNDKVVQETLRKLLPAKMITSVQPNPQYSQGQASRSFMDGLHELNAFWAKKFSITAQGMRRSLWIDDDRGLEEWKLPEDSDPPMERSDFRAATFDLEGSQDLGAQLFCALLRSIGVETRLVCSLQVLPFATNAQPSTPASAKNQKKIIYLGSSADEGSSAAAPSYEPPAIKRITRIGQSRGRNAPIDRGKPPPTEKLKINPAFKAPYPVYWVEAFNSALQKWIPIDPLATFTVDKPLKFEPPLNHSQNLMVYVVGFEEDGFAKDITRRYTKAFNAKTRKMRVEGTEGGEKWWRKALKAFKRAVVLDREQVEDAVLARKEAAEGLPRNVQDFKDHPVYVLERHLKHNEVIHPKNIVGKVNVGSAASDNVEPVYRRRDVHIVRSADKWYRFGRELKVGEQPLKYSKVRRDRRPRSPGIDGEPSGEEEDMGIGLYATFQTELYIPPPVVRGRVPRNAYGNLDVYVPSMVPQGGTHIRHPEAAKAARIIAVDYADAVTGFKFQGRQGTAVVEGIVAPAEYRAAIESVIEGLAYMRDMEEDNARRVEVLRMWRRFLTGLRIIERVNREYGTTAADKDLQEELDREEEGMDEEAAAGGFFPGAEEEIDLEPTARHFDGHVGNEKDYSGGFIPDDGDESFQSPVLIRGHTRGHASNDAAKTGNWSFNGEPEEGGRFIPAGEEEEGSFLHGMIAEGGWFIPEEDEAEGEAEGDGFLPDDGAAGGGLLPEGTQDGDSFLQEGKSSAAVQETGNSLVTDVTGGLFSEKAAHLTKSEVNIVSLTDTQRGVQNSSSGETNNTTISQPDMDEIGLQNKAEEGPESALSASINLTKASEELKKADAVSNDDDQGSLLSHDPDDEDAEPDWLLSD